MKPYLTQRIGAYFIDLFIVVLISNIIMLPFPTNNNLQKLDAELTEITEKALNNEISTSVYISQTKDISFSIAYEQVGYIIVEIVTLILYFIVFQFYNKGQTLGKRLFKIKLVKENSENLTMNDVLIRSGLINMIFYEIVMLGFIIMNNSDLYFYASFILETIQLIFIIICIIMASRRKDGKAVHDLITHTRVVKVERKELVVCDN